MPREEVIVTAIIKYINSLDGGVAEKVQGTSMSSGKADINACYRGRSIRIEVKTPDHGNKTSKKQEINLKRWKAAGAYCCVAYNLSDVKDLIQIIEEETMKDREKILLLLRKINSKVVYEFQDHIEIENPCIGENISFDFNLDGDLLRIYS